MTPSYLFKRPKAWPFKRQSHKMIKHTQTIRWLLPKNCLSVVFEHWVFEHLKGQAFGRLNRYEGVIIKDKFWIHVFLSAHSSQQKCPVLIIHVISKFERY